MTKDILKAENRYWFRVAIVFVLGCTAGKPTHRLVKQQKRSERK